MLIPEIDHLIARFHFDERKENAVLVRVIVRKIIRDHLSIRRINRVNVAASAVNLVDTGRRFDHLVIV